ncbi:unnamed protein product [Cylicocyclus nassatus]|uniref:UDP-glucuronosyltransferase n=1 Tax=Cylicocyclus nassatus TaxID=53992 RepID=A0AA36GES3_CYLNA|nr:unnamed protein product [Cylicocyclus nassatus]
MKQTSYLLMIMAAVEAGKILVYSPSVSYSHLIMNGRIADTLVKAGHDVVMFIPEYVKATSKFDETLAKIVRMNNIKLMARRQELEYLKDYGFDAAFTEQIDFCGVGVIRYLGIQNLLWISSTPLMETVSYNLGVPSPTSYVPVVEESDNGDTMSFWRRALNMYMYIGTIYIHRRGTDLTTEVFRKIDPDFPHVREIAANASLCFVNADEMFDLPRPIIHKLIYIGGLHISNPKPLDEKFNTVMNKGKKGVVIVSLGTVVPFHVLPEGVKLGFANVVRSMPDYHFILKVSKGDTSTSSFFENGSNCDFIEWLPQSDILAHPRLKLFVTHGGINGLTEALLRGVPLVVIPMFGDQFRNGRNVEKRGVGKVLPKWALSEDAIRAAIQEVLNNDSYKQNALRMSKLMQTKPFSAEERLVQWTNFALKNGALDVLHVEGSRMNSIAYFNIDVIAFILLIMCLISTAVAKLLLAIRRRYLIEKVKKN